MWRIMAEIIFFSREENLVRFPQTETGMKFHVPAEQRAHHKARATLELSSSKHMYVL